MSQLPSPHLECHVFFEWSQSVFHFDVINAIRNNGTIQYENKTLPFFRLKYSDS